MPAYRKVGSSWINIKNIYRKVGSSWVNIKTVYRKVGESWVKVFSGINGPKIATPVIISQSTNSSTGLITLTGTNYHWTNSVSLSYKIQHLDNYSSTWTTLASGVATNPSSGSSNTYTYQLLNNGSDVTPNQENVYRFQVTATSSTSAITISESTSTSVDGPRNITSLSAITANTTYNSVKLQWYGGTYSSSYMVRYTLGPTSYYYYNTSSGDPSTIVVPGLNPNTNYTFYVTGYTGGIVSSISTGYRGNESSSITTSTAVAPLPVQISSPTLSGTAEVFTSITAGGGSYQAGTTGGVTTKIVYYFSPYTAPTDGESSSSANIETTPSPAPTYTIGQADASPKKYYYARDAVLNVSGGVTSYYYSAVKPVYVGAITDNFNRSIGSGIGTSSSGYLYLAQQQNASWSVNGSVAINSNSIVAFVNAMTVQGTYNTNYPLESIELAGKTDITASVELPDGGGGPGIAFWVSGAGSFWAVAPSYYKTSSSSTSYTCDALSSTTTDASGTGCHGCSVTTTTTTNTSSDCNLPVEKSTDASGTGCYGCPVTTHYGSTSYSCGSGSTYNYGSAIVAQAACHGCGYSDTSYTSGPFCNGSTSNYSDSSLSPYTCGGKCSCTGPFTNTTYGCTGSGTSRSCPPLNATTVGGRCGACVSNFPAPGLFTYPVYAATNTTYYTCTISTCSTVSQFSCTYTTYTTSTYYGCYGRDTSTSTTTYKCSVKENTTVTSTYNTQLRILSTGTSSDGVGATNWVLPRATATINTNNSSFNKVRKISVTTSGNSITGTAYSDLFGSVIGTVSFTRNAATHPAKSSANGSSYAGIIKTPSSVNSSSIDDNTGSQFDNLSIT